MRHMRIPMHRRYLPIVKRLMNNDAHGIFEAPVDPVRLGLVDYFAVVRHPMDLGTVRRRCESGSCVL